MVDREKVIKGLECCSKGDCADCDNCTYHGVQTDVPCESTLMRDALALLKAQEPVNVDAVPVVRCRDCKFYYGVNEECGCNGGYHSEDWYCADGERRGRNI